MAIGFEAYRKLDFGNFVNDFYVFFLFLRSIEKFPHMFRLEIVHELVDEFWNGNFRQISMSFIANEPHCKNVAQRRCDELWVLANEQLKPDSEFLICSHVI